MKFAITVSLPLLFLSVSSVDAQDLWNSPKHKASPWRAINDALFASLIDSRVSEMPQRAEPEALWSSMAASGTLVQGVVELPLGSDGGRKSREYDTRSTEIAGTVITVLSGGIDGVPAGLFLKLGEGDHEIPGLRGSLSNCSELNETDCDRIDYSRSRSLTLGLASCLCYGQAVDLGGGVLGLGCYFGRGGTYMDHVIGYGPTTSDLLRLFVDDPDIKYRRTVCQGTPLAHRFPSFLLLDGELPSSPMPGLDADMQPVFLAASTDEDWGEDLDPVTILRHFGVGSD